LPRAPKKRYQAHLRCAGKFEYCSDSGLQLWHNIRDAGKLYGRFTICLRYSYSVVSHRARQAAGTRFRHTHVMDLRSLLSASSSCTPANCKDFDIVEPELQTATLSTEALRRKVQLYTSAVLFTRSLHDRVDACSCLEQL
jgi:hypothetical protein